MRNGHSGPGSSIRVVESECDLRVGGEWIIRFGPASAPTSNGTSSTPWRGRDRLVYASITESPDGSRVESLMEIACQWLEGQTLLTLTRRGLPSGDIERGYIDGWNEFLDGFVARIQTRSAT